jgi:hypothetical protein
MRVMTETTALTVRDRTDLTTADILDAFASFLRLNVAQAELHGWRCWGGG